MAASTIQIKIDGAIKLNAMAAALKKAGREDLRAGLDRAIRKASKPTVEAIQEGARNIQTTGFPRPPSLHRRPFTAVIPPHHTRDKIVQAVTATVSTSGQDPRVQFRVAEARLPLVLKGMPRKFDSPDKWRHPVMGNREVWVDQRGKSWFWPPIEQHIKDFRQAIDDELDIVRQKLEAA